MPNYDLLYRLADAHYRRCLADPLLSEVFGTEYKPVHVEAVAAWLDEVFNSPEDPSHYEGLSALIAPHAGMAITEAQRLRFIEIFLEAADEVVPDAGPAFRDWLRKFLRWITAIVVALSQAKPHYRDSSAGEIKPHRPQ
jgi:hemoglobin